MRSDVEVAVDQQDRIWAYYPGSSHLTGMSVLDGQTWITYTTDNSDLVNDHIITIAFDDQDRAWIGTKKGLNLFDGKTWATYTTENSGLLHDHITTIAFDQQNKAWIGAQGELSVFDGQAWLSYPIDGGPVSEYLYRAPPYVIAFDEQNQAWIGIPEGVNVLDGASGELILRDTECTVAGVITAQDQVWLVPQVRRPIRVFVEGNWLRYSSDNSALPRSKISAYAVDHEGRIWFGSEKGIAVVAPSEARPISDGAVSILHSFSWGGHALLPIVIAGLWLGLWRDALPGVGVGIGVGLFIFWLGIGRTMGEVFFVLSCLGTTTGIVGGLLGTVILRRIKASFSKEPAPAVDLASTATGIMGGGGCAIASVVVIVACVLSSCAAVVLYYILFLQQ